MENGAEFLPELFRRLRSIDRKMPGYFGDDPVEVFRRHVWINPFWEDDLASVVEWMGADASCSDRTGPTSKACPSRSTT